MFAAFIKKVVSKISKLSWMNDLVADKKVGGAAPQFLPLLIFITFLCRSTTAMHVNTIKNSTSIIY